VLAMRAAVIAFGRFSDTRVRYDRDFSTSLETAFKVSKTPSPVTATASK
jgi:hypothetical protein